MSTIDDGLSKYLRGDRAQAILADYSAIEVRVAEAMLAQDEKRKADLDLMRSTYMYRSVDRYGRPQQRSLTGRLNYRQRQPNVPRYNYPRAAGRAATWCGCSVCQSQRVDEEADVLTPLHPSARKFAYDRGAALRIREQLEEARRYL